jgi:hypothetical protein
LLGFARNDVGKPERKLPLTRWPVTPRTLRASVPAPIRT